MKAALFTRFGGPDVLEIVDLPEPHPGPGEVRVAVRAAGVNASDWKKRLGQMDPELPQTMGYEAAGVVDELGADVTGVALGDLVYGFSGGAAQAEYAVLSTYAAVPPKLDFTQAAALPASAETAARALDQLGLAREGGGDRQPTLLISGASGNVGGAATQLAVARGARVLGTASAAKQDYVRSLGAEPVVYGDGLSARVRALAPDGVDLALDVAGSGILPELIELAGGSENVITVADFLGARDNGVRFSRGDAGRALYVLTELAELIAEGRFVIPPVRAFPLADIAEAHRVGESGRAGGKLVLTIG